MPSRTGPCCLRLIGGLLVHAADPEYRWFRRTVDRVTTEVAPPGKLARLIGFETRPKGAHGLRFLGIDVERLDEIPEGLIAWEVHDDRWIVRQAGGEIAWQAPLTWRWRTASATGRWVGEFSTECPADWGGGRGDFGLTAHSYLIPGQSADDAILLVAPDPTWPRRFAEFAAELRATFRPAVLRRIEHYGSTAIPGLPAKPIIDVLVEVPSFDLARQEMLPHLNREEWEYWWYQDHMILIKRETLLGRRTHHLHLAPAGHRLWEGLAFRDYLRAHPEVAARYAALKHELATAHQEDREGYTAAKTAFVREITERALRPGR
jgi:GrpB-like predicted nucleotidyltransferase (UPF0157 family)